MSHDLHPSRLGTTNEDGSRAFVYQADFKGFWNTRRRFAHTALIVFFLILPWLKVDGDQIILFDVINRKFIFFGQIFWAHDFPILWLLAISLFLAILFVTAVWGRVWCGWGCPQTVFVDGVFRRIERWLEGNHLERRRRDSAPMSLDKLWRKSLKWALFVAVTCAVVFTFMAYFVGTETFGEILAHPARRNTGYFVMSLGLGAILLFDFAWFREQFCVIICPYGRLQSVLMDTTSVTVLYDEKRGEPRRGSVGPMEKTGDCVNCGRCIDVCPTGIDIRRGVQMECINCTACIDACDLVMTRMKRPAGLIRFDSLLGRANHARFSVRSELYLGAIFALLAAFVVVVLNRQPIDYEFLRGRGEPFSLLKEDGQEYVVNHFQVQVSSQTREEVAIEFRISPELDRLGVRLTTPFRPLPLKMGEIKRTELFIRFPKSLIQNGSGRLKLETVAHGARGHDEKQHEIRLVGPFL